jgi:hypothetical protein
MENTNKDLNLGGGKTYTIALADKAAFLNRLKKQNIQVTSGDIVDNNLNKTFQLTLHDSASVEIADQLLQQSKDIDDKPSLKLPPIDKSHPKIQELKKLIKNELKEILIKRK